MIDFKMDKIGVPAVVDRIERDPNRSALIALLKYKDGEKRYNVAVEGMKEGSQIVTEEKAPVKAGNRLAIKNIPVGTQFLSSKWFPEKARNLRDPLDPL